jgi:uncharacterized membrane protein
MKRSPPCFLLTVLLMVLLTTPTVLFAVRDAGSVADSLRERGFSPLLITGLISMIPIFELRGGIPVGIALFKLNPMAVYFTCVVFNLIPVLPILLLLNPLRKLLSRVPPFRGLFRFLARRAERNQRLIERYEEIGLTLFVGIPLPVTGAWTGSVVAEVLGLRVMKSFLFITLGVVLAGIIVTMLTMLRVYGIIGALIILLTFTAVYIIRVRRDLKSRKIQEAAEAAGNGGEETITS